ncbi:hypothetical protein BC834DRAFT_668488 [Gloeopeniophorella convolvens]|nr:hypothetical protein BC834DRAFT_668488 [Gloeopeniophorella convolvens]
MDRLPDDVLLEIFVVCGERASYWLRWWYELIHVCRRWRQLILASPKRLRLRLLITRDSKVASILRHAPPLPLVINCVQEYHEEPDYEPLPWPRESEEGIALALTLRSRVANISIWGDSALLERLFATMTVPTPGLDTLYVESADDTPSSVFPDGFLGGSAPSLRSLWLRNVLPPPLSAPRLTCFTVHFQRDPVGVDVPLIGQLSDSVCAMPQLQSLELDLRGVDEDDQTTPTTDTPTSLSELTTLVFSGRSHQLEALSQKIDAPGLMRLDAHLYDLEHPPVTVPSLLRFVCHSPNLHVPDAAARVDISESHSSISIHQCRPYRGRGASIWIDLDHVPSVDLGVSIASVIASCQSLEPALIARRLRIASGHPYYTAKDPWLQFLHHVEEWHSLLAMFPRVTNATVENIHALAVCRTLQQPSGYELLPDLRDLEIIFYTDDALGPPDVSVELEPVISERNSGAAQNVNVSYKENWDLYQLAKQPQWMRAQRQRRRQRPLLEAVGTT